MIIIICSEYGSHDLPHRIYDCQIYPTRAQNGSTVILYGHVNGIRVVWRGGKRLRTARSSKSKHGVNGTGSNANLIDLDPALQASEYESEEDDDYEEPYPSIVRHVDLHLGTEVLHLAVPNISSATTSLFSEPLPALFKDKIVITAACADCTVRVITLPIAPPPVEHSIDLGSPVKESQWGEEMLIFGGVTGHQGIPRGVSVSWTPRMSEKADDNVEQDMDEDDDESDDEGERSHTVPGSTTHTEPSEWDLVIASHSNEVSGLLLIFRLPLGSDSKLESIAAENLLPYQTHSLLSAAATVSFNPAIYPSKLHTQLLIAESQGTIRIFDPMVTRETGQEAMQATERGAWLASFSCGFESPKDLDLQSPGIIRRKRILDAQWTSHGRSVVVLLADGQWGIWDVAGAGPRPQSGAGGTRSAHFALTGYINGDVPANIVETTLKKPRGSRSSLAPMTPNTRRVKEETLFSGPGSSASMRTRGGVSVSSSRTASGGWTDESVVLWYGNEVYSIPRFQAFWQRSVNSNNANTGSLYSPGLSRLDGLSLYGEAISCLKQFPSISPESGAIGSTLQDLLIAAESRLMILSSAVQAPEEPRPTLSVVRDQNEDVQSDRHLLSRGELDLGGMNRLLDSMTASTANGANRTSIARRVGFAT